MKALTGRQAGLAIRQLTLRQVRAPSISTPDPGAGFAFRCGGMLNNSGTVNQTGNFNLYAVELGDSAIINNLAGSTWNLQGGAWINLPRPFGDDGYWGYVQQRR